MCLAVPGKIIEAHDDDAVVDLQGNRLPIRRTLTPQAGVGDWVLVHAGFAIATLDEAEARQTWDYLRGAYGDLFAPDGELSDAVAENERRPDLRTRKT